MLIALVTMYMLGGPVGLIVDIKQVRKDVKMVMEASDERNAALSTLKQMETLTKRRDKSIKKIQKQMIATIAIHGHEIDDLDQLWTEYRGTRSIFNNEFLELRFELKEHISREDWAKLFSQG